MLTELNRRLDVIDGYVDGVHAKAEANMPELAPPYPNRLIRRQKIYEMVEENLFSPDLQQLHESVPRTFMGPEFIRQLIENEKPEEIERDEKEKKKILLLDNTEYTSVKAKRNTKKAPQKL